MVLGIGKNRRSIADTASDLLGGDGGGSGFNGFPDTLTPSDFNKGGSGTVDMTQNEWVQVDYFVVPPQEEYIIGSKDIESEEVGKLLYQAADAASGASMDDNKVRFGYQTRAGRNSDYVFSGTVSRLDQSDVEDRVQLSPQPWGSGGGKAPANRGKPPHAREDDRIVIEQLSPNSGQTLDLAASGTYWEVPVEFAAE